MINQRKRRRMLEALDLNALLHPGSAFRTPRDVADDPDLTIGEKRAILASWASDACAVSSAPELRAPSGARGTVSFDDIMDALKALDEEARRAGVPALPKSIRGWRRGGSENDPGETPPALGV